MWRWQNRTSAFLFNLRLQKFLGDLIKHSLDLSASCLFSMKKTKNHASNLHEINSNYLL